ncbi:MAG TPA: hypothetical protein P5556_10665 [Candidatus Gastranaerophilales bacterium]|nr:hypothetical protein [Candidatus Gastranaerophilales bacterium]
MGLFTGLLRLAYLKQEELTLEYRIQTLSATKIQVADRAVNLVTIGSDLDPQSPEYKTMEARREKLLLMEKKLDQELLRYQTLLKAVSAEVQSAQKIVDNSIKRFFSYGGGS